MKLKKKLCNKGKILLSFKHLPQVIQDNILAYNISITNITNASDEEITEYFRYLQNQERLRAGEIINSVPDTELDKYLKMINDIDLLLDKLSFGNKRKQFDRVFYSILGLIDGKIGFGVTDKEVMRFVSECSELNEETIAKTLYCIDVLNSIVDNNCIPIKYMSCNARAMKFFLLLIVLKFVDFTENGKDKLKALDSINEKLSAFSSAKADSVKGAFHGYSDAVVEEYRLLALISKGGHSFKRVENRMKILAYYVNGFDNKIQPSGIIPV